MCARSAPSTSSAWSGVRRSRRKTPNGSRLSKRIALIVFTESTRAPGWVAPHVAQIAPPPDGLKRFSPSASRS